jgi:transketolase
MNLEPLVDKFKAFNWRVSEVDGHDLEQLDLALTNAKLDRSGKPKCIVAHTIKGKGVSFMEDRLAWHYRSPSESDYQAARLEIQVA